MRMIVLSAAAIGALALGGCARNYGAEGALGGAAVGAGVAAIAGGDAATGAAIGAAAGGIGGSQIDKRDRRRGCYRYDRDGDRRWDRDC